jgi:16S rRNA (adenine(1408)-N(1))-methyltransferase
VIVDVGTGDGRSVLRRARTDERSLFIGIDANAAGMREASRRAARPRGREGVANAMFLVEGAEALPGPLAERADEVTVVLPWGSLLHGMLRADPAVVGALRGLLREGGRLEALLSVAAADGVRDYDQLTDQSLTCMAGAYRALGLECVEIRPANDTDVERLSSSWARRLGIPDRRDAWVVSFRREPVREPAAGRAASSGPNTTIPGD